MPRRPAPTPPPVPPAPDQAATHRARALESFDQFTGAYLAILNLLDAALAAWPRSLEGWLRYGEHLAVLDRLRPDAAAFLVTYGRETPADARRHVASVLKECRLAQLIPFAGSLERLQAVRDIVSELGVPLQQGRRQGLLDLEEKRPSEVEGAPAARRLPPQGDLPQAVAAASEQGSPPKVTHESPRKMLMGWKEIAAALNMKYSQRKDIKALNQRFGGPIRNHGRGTKPMVYLDGLVEWWNGLAIQQQDQANQREGARLSAEAQHNYGREGRAAPEVGGGVKKRRRDRQT
jgi:hypothetical protein